MIRFLHGDCREVLRKLAPDSVHCIVTSPPYYGLRDYGTGSWEGGNPDHTHDVVPARGGRGGSGSPGKQTVGATPSFISARECSCGARRIDHQIGMEETPDAYVASMIEVFRELRRVLRPDGVAWLNLGDSYASGGGTGTQGARGQRFDRRHTQEALLDKRYWLESGIKPKDLLMIPHRIALALQADGWWVRADNVWAKRNSMPESVDDRTTRSHEYVFQLTKSERYFYDAVAIEEDADIPAGTRAAKGAGARRQAKGVNGRPAEYWEYTGRRNKRSVWFIPTTPYLEAHFAVMSPELAETCILAGTSEVGACRACGAPWERLIEKHKGFAGGSGRAGRTAEEANASGKWAGATHGRDVALGPVVYKQTIGWQMSCDCPIGKPVPCIVLDPFSGAGTTALISDRLGRDAIGIDLNEAYVDMAVRRVSKDAGFFAEIT